MERINFMISHLLVLERMQASDILMDSLQSVLQRVQDALKEAASLIEAYRKQSKIARRLKMSNTQNFESMADRIKSCSSDLMLSLQIQQTGDLSVLKRAVPRDVVAETFVKDNGGQDVINVSNMMAHIEDRRSYSQAWRCPSELRPSSDMLFFSTTIE